jgi:hypothetical protein
MRPSPEAPNPAATEPPAATKAAAVIDAVSEEATDDTVVAMVRPGEDAAVADQGRVLLRMLEHGRGPAVELAWPARAVDRERLYRVFRDCLGMRVALRDAAGRLFVRESPPGQPWQPNVDRYSGFARQPTGRLAAAERRDIRAIGRRHGLSRRAAAIRVFPRRVDALLLGGLSRLVGDGYADARSIRASYRLADGVVAVVGVQVDGRPVAGGVELGAAANTSCRSG